MSRSSSLVSSLVTLILCGCSAGPASPTGNGGASAAAGGGSQQGGATTSSGGATAASGGGSLVGGGQGGTATTKTGGGSPATGGTASTIGGAPPTGGNTSATGATTAVGGISATGGTRSGGGSLGTGGIIGTGGSKSSGGATSAGGAGGAPTGGAAAGGNTGTGGITTSLVGGAASTGGVVGTGGSSTCLPPPKQCGNQDYVQGCISGNSTTPCGGKCVGFANACQENATTKGATATAFACPSWMLFSDAMNQAAILDGNTAFNYAVVGHDVDMGGIDGNATSSCCQCYQIVYDYPSPTLDKQALINPDNPSILQSGITPLPPPLIVQSFNTATNGPDDFDVFMAAGGFGGNNACDPNTSMKDVSGLYFYTKFPPDNTNQGMVKAATNYQECKTSLSWVTTASLSTSACQTTVQNACNQFAGPTAAIAAESVRSCTQSNSPQSFYHLNWYVHAKKVECPSHLTDVTGCKLAPQGLPAVDPNVTTSAQAAADSSFRATAANGNHFYTTTMQDCCKPSCASQNWVSGKGLKPVGLYNSFYSCDQAGNPITEATCN